MHFKDSSTEYIQEVTFTDGMIYINGDKTSLLLVLFGIPVIFVLRRRKRKKT